MSDAPPTLLSRVLTATEGDREIDWALAMRFDEPCDAPRLKPYTSSIDAALALVERVRPKARWIVATTDERDRCVYQADLWLGDEPPVCSEAATPAVALIAALLRSLDQ